MLLLSTFKLLVCVVGRNAIRAPWPGPFGSSAGNQAQLVYGSAQPIEHIQKECQNFIALLVKVQLRAPSRVFEPHALPSLVLLASAQA